MAVRTAENLASGTLKAKREKPMTDRIVAAALKYNFVKDYIFNKARAQVMKQTNGLYPAPLKVKSLVLLFLIKSLNFLVCVDLRSVANNFRQRVGSRIRC